ncbi:MAG: alpha/beta hydrolase [Bacteroidetes bacterium]|nr:MAG: alpha/beta hydrolase [Bacteroidota bacterium]
MIKQLFFILVSFFIGFNASAGNAIIQTEKRGQGEAMILIHGMACSSEVWEDVAAYYENRYEIHLVNIAGFGNKQSLETPHVLKAIRDEIVGYIQSEGLEKPVMMGHSMGGFISLWIAAEYPGLLGKIISVDGLPYFPVMAMPGITAETAGPIVEMMQNNMNNSNPETARASQEMMIATMIATEEKRPKVVEMGMNSNSAVIAQAMGEMFTTDIREDVQAIDAPVLALGSWYAYRAYGTTLESARKGYEAQFNPIPNARVAMADKAYHFIFYDEPEWFFTMVDNFLAE